MKPYYFLILITFSLFTSSFTTPKGKKESKKVSNSETIPQDTTIKKGMLKNGLTYYIIKNELSENKVDFYLINNAGAIQEDDNQVGMSDFITQIAFRKTKNYETDEFPSYAKNIGININANTFMNNTMYSIQDISTSRNTTIDSVMIMIHDLACGITINQDQINNAKNIIKETLPKSNTLITNSYA